MTDKPQGPNSAPPPADSGPSTLILDADQNPLASGGGDAARTSVDPQHQSSPSPAPASAVPPPTLILPDPQPDAAESAAAPASQSAPAPASSAATVRRQTAKPTRVESPPRRRHANAGWLMFFLLAAALLYLLLEFYWPSQERAEARWAELHAEVIQTRRIGTTLAELEVERDRFAAEAEIREREIAALQEVREELFVKLKKEIERGDIAIKESDGDLVVDLVDKILFESGDAQVSDRGKEVLCQVAESLIKIPDKMFQVGGHTDAVPISPKLVEQYPTNWELSALRATNVVRFLQEECEVPGKRLSAVAFSQYRPVASNRRSSGRRRNRRIELTLLPLKRRR